MITTWTGKAPTGATYELHVTATATGFDLAAFSCGAGAARKAQGAASFTDVTEAQNALLKKAREKRAGRERAYTLDLAGNSTPDLPSLAKDGTVTPHPQLTIDGVASAVRTVHVPVTTTTGPSVQLCTTITDPESYLTGDAWIATRKVEGQRAVIHITGGQVVCSNRSGGVIACPEVVATAAALLPDDTLLDGELVGFDEHGREALYVTSATIRTVFVAFDLLRLVGVDMLGAAQTARFIALTHLLTSYQSNALMLVPLATTETEKRDLLDQARAKHWEGIVFRRADSTYTGGRPGTWVRFKLRRADLDLVVMDYCDGKGRRAATVGGVKVGLYDATNTLVSVGEVGGGWTDAQLAELAARRAAGRTGYVITARAEGFTAARKLIRPSAVAIRADGDKQPSECRFDDDNTALLATATV